MIINGKNISEFNAMLLDRSISLIDFNNETLTPDGSLNDIVYETKLGRKDLDVVLELKGSPLSILENKSMLMAEFMNEPVIEFRRIPGRIFKGFIVSSSSLDKNFLYETVEFKMNVSESSEEINLNFYGVSDIMLRSTMETPVSMRLYPIVNQNSVTIEGFSDEDIVINNLRAGKAITIYSEDSLVLEEGVNKFPDYDSMHFPTLKPGMNNVRVSGQTEVQLLYSPRWL